jgi:Cd2+/Zn2+-exporting ATPase
MVFPKAWQSLVSQRPDMNLLMTVAVIGAAAIGEWSEGATVAFLFSLSLLLESWSVGRARNAISKLMDLSPPMANVKLPDGRSKEVAPTEVEVGSIVVIRPGDKLPLDGKSRIGCKQYQPSIDHRRKRACRKEAGRHGLCGNGQW